MRRREFVGLVGSAAVLPAFSVLAQRRAFQIGWLAFGRNAEGQIDRTLREALAQYGLVESRNLNIVYRFANANSALLSPLAHELVAQKPNILVGIGGDVVKALIEASNGGCERQPSKCWICSVIGASWKEFHGRNISHG
jgi:putative ABC transport system substrate-binding protein